ncbi:MAG: 2-oxoglutarate dehydrogenase E1 component [Planctomycetaceae bacterium]|nr:2-oxoglutarate dehydrogenase E1 component [Planctomycetaceae bacterium]
MSIAEEPFSSQSLSFVEELYAEYMRDPQAVSSEWQRYFADLMREEPTSSCQIGPSFRPGTLFNPAGESANGNGHGGNGHGGNGHATALLSPPGEGHGVPSAVREMSIANLQDRIDQLIRAYRVRGHRIAKLDPLGQPRDKPRELELDFYGLTEADLDRTFSTRTVGGPDVATLRQVLDRLQSTYCRSIGVQYMHIDDADCRKWLQDRMELTENRRTLSWKDQTRIFTRLTDAVIFEEFIHKKYVGSKRFSLEGGESLIPLLEQAIEGAGEQGVQEVVLAMAHRGRLNVLANVMGKSPRQIFAEFDDKATEMAARGGGDVKYHLGYSNDYVTSHGKKVHLSLCFNPSHLEFINPVALGRMRAKLDRLRDRELRKGLVILVHGDAAFCGEGMTQETFNMSGLNAYATGGAIHVVLNNQIGFTTLPEQGRSTLYCTDVAKMVQSPIFHVNGEDPEAVAQVIHLAMEFRKQFQRDVVIDMYCFRRYGHNEGDEASFTQPLMYQAIEKRKTVREAYLDHLLKLGGMSREEADQIAAQRRANLEHELDEARSESFKPRAEVANNVWMRYNGGVDIDSYEVVPTSVPEPRLKELLEKLTKHPESFHPHHKLEKILKERAEMATGARKLDWGAAESLAFATIVTEGHAIRMTGQDVERGTFSHRHAMLHDVRNGTKYMPLQHLSPDQKPFFLCNSPLSETAVLGFEYGYSLDFPDALVVWEAQFGDFVNVAQVIIDQFIASAEEKWRRLSGLVMLLPHGFEGQGPEHSSGRLERFLSLVANDNMRVVVPSTPAQYFHLLRRQVLGKMRKPLIVMTPKGFLRNQDSPITDLANGHFQSVMADEGERKSVTRVLLCGGRVYFDLVKERAEKGRDDVAILRLEQLAPLPTEALKAALQKYPDGTPVVWVQDEPENMGAWRYLRVLLGERLFGRLPFSYASRKAAASPATGSPTAHKKEQREILNQAFGGT